MKFTQQNAFEQIKAALGKTAQKQKLSDRTINEVLKNLIPAMATDDTELADFLKGAIPMFESMNQNHNKDVHDAVKKYEEDNPRPTGDSDDPDVEPTRKKSAEPDDDNPLKKQIAELTKSMEVMAKSLETVTGVVTINQKEKQAAALKAELYAECEEKYGKEFAKEHFDKVTKRIDFNGEHARTLVEEDISERASDTGTALRDPNKPPASDDDECDFSGEVERLQKAGQKKAPPAPPAAE